jgi:anti-sigma factor RsiW
MNCREVRNLAHASLDGELDLVRQMAIDDHVRQCGACQTIYDSQRALRAALKADGVYFNAPADLERRIRSVVRTAAAPPRWRSAAFSLPRLTLAAATAAIVIAVIGGPLVLRRSHSDQIAHEVVSAHIRSLMPGHLTDVLSSDQHTVKPWFAGKVDFSPPVVDLKDEEFPLVGGRLDYIDNRPVAALTYRRREHIINLFVWPSPSKTDAPETLEEGQGYNALSWTRDHTNFWAVSDLNASELRQFVQLVRDRASG